MVFCCIWCRLTSTASGWAFGQTMKHGNKVLRDKISLHQESWNAKDYDAVNYVALTTCGWIKMNDAKSKPKLPYLHSKRFSKMFYFFKRNNWNVFQNVKHSIHLNQMTYSLSTTFIQPSRPYPCAKMRKKRILY